MGATLLLAPTNPAFLFISLRNLVRTKTGCTGVYTQLTALDGLYLSVEGNGLEV